MFKGSYLVIVFLCFLVFGCTGEVRELDDEVDVPEEIQPETELLFGFNRADFEILERKIKPNENLSSILSAEEVSFLFIDSLAKMSSAKASFDVKHLMFNKKYFLLKNKAKDLSEYFVYQPNEEDYVVFKLESPLDVYTGSKESKLVERSMTGVIEKNSSIYEIMIAAGATPKLVNELVDIFAWQINFFTIQEGDKFKILFEERLIDGESIGVGNILAANFTSTSNEYNAYLFDHDSTHTYYDETGNSLQKAFLRDPVDFTRISSRYSASRFHPVLKVRKAHLGTDYVAAEGTPIRATADGVISEASFTRGNGNYVKIKHNSTFSTQYLHMSRFGKGIKKNRKVARGQVIGYVGSTGLATGAHLCYRFWKNGEQVDALKVEVPAEKPLDESLASDYEIVKTELASKLNAISFAKLQDTPSSVDNFSSSR